MQREMQFEDGGTGAEAAAVKTGAEGSTSESTAAEKRIPDLTERLRGVADRIGLEVDGDVYRRAGRDPRDPVLLGSGRLDVPLGIFGRDPGATEIELGEPFIGAGGQLVRRALLAHGGVEPPAGDRHLRSIGTHVFWANTVPYKPVGNKAWGIRVRRAFRPVIAELIEKRWTGCDLITLGNNAFFWFGLDDREVATRLSEFWERDDRYTASIEVPLGAKFVRLHPLPHPSPLNARYFREFPEMMGRRLAALEWKPPRQGGGRPPV